MLVENKENDRKNYSVFVFTGARAVVNFSSKI